MSGQHRASTANHSEQQEENEVHVEIEHITGDENDIEAEDSLHITTSREDVAQSMVNGGSPKELARVMGRRTVILPHQKQILEDFFKTGMTSASHQLRHLHEAASDQTGLEIHVIKNWVRNRRRPVAAQKRQESQQVMMVALGSTPQPPGVSGVPSLTNTATIPVSVPHSALHSHVLTPPPPPPLAAPEPKRVCIDRQYNNVSSLIVKARVADGEETDFVEVELENISYIGLLKCCCEELEISPGDIAKIRKLPNVLVRKDKDVARMTNGQEIEVVLKNSAYATSSMAYVPPSLINFSSQESDHHCSN